MSAIALLGLAILPATFFSASFLLAGRLQLLKMLFNSAAMLCLLVFFTQAAVEIPTFAQVFGAFDWLCIAMILLYILWESLDLLNSILYTFGNLVKKR